MAKAWWRKRLLRIYHPDIREDELRELNVSRFVADCLATQAEAIVIRAGGGSALYPSQVPYHDIDPEIGQRDLLGEIVAQAHAHNLHVIAQVVFSKAREEVWLAHPDWFQRSDDGQLVRDGDYYLTCPLGGYQNADFALPVLREILSRYAVDGLHLNTIGFADHCHCSSCEVAFGGPIPESPEADPDMWAQYLSWRARAVVNQLLGYYKTILELNPECLFIVELAGPQDPIGARKATQHLPALARSCSHIAFTANDVASARSFRWWVGLAADQARAVRRKRGPLISLKMHDPHRSEALTPPDEFAFSSYQALAHGAGIKIVTGGPPSEQLDPRTMPAITEVFRFMREQEEVLTGTMPIYDVGLVWPGATLTLYGDHLAQGDVVSGLRNECLGLYAAFKARHVLVGLLYDELITPKRLSNFSVVVLPTAVWLSNEAAEALASYVLEGGRLVLLDSPAASSEQGFRPMPRPLAELVGDIWSEEARTAPYMMPVAQLLAGPRTDKRSPLLTSRRASSSSRAFSESLARDWTREAVQDGLSGARLGQGIGPVRLDLPYRKIRESDKALVWMRSAYLRPNAPFAAGDQSNLGGDPLLLVALAGQGLILYAATGLGQMYLNTGYEDYATILEAMISHGSPIKPYLLTNAPSAVEVTMAHWKLGVVIHLVNASGPVPLSAPASVGPIELDLAWDGPAEAHLCTPGSPPQTLRCREEWNRVRITVPQLGAYAQVVVRSG